LLCAVAAVVAAALALPVATSPLSTTATTPLDSEEQAFLNLLNQYRGQNGLGTVSIEPNLQAASEWMSTDMGVHNYFSHTDSLGRDPFQRMREFGYNYNTWLGENIAAGTSSAQVVFDLWKNSPGHNGNMLNANYKVIGIGRAYTAGSNYGWYWTNDFGGYLPPPAPSDDTDGDGFINATEASVGTNPYDPCGNPDPARPGTPSLSWPADLSMSGSPNEVDLADLSSFISPVRMLGTSPGDPGFDQRWDLVPGRGNMADVINLMDLTSLVTTAPPMFGNQRAFNGPACTP